MIKIGPALSVAYKWKEKTRLNTIKSTNRM
jgi:hypothetical protein